MNLSGETQSIIAGALFDFIEHLGSQPKTVTAGEDLPKPDLFEVLSKWAQERTFDMEVADEMGWSKFSGDADDIRVLATETKQLGPRIGGALRSFTEYATLAESEDFESVLLKWASKTGLQIHDPQHRWSSIWWG